jgi:hypothetical protein
LEQGQKDIIEALSGKQNDLENIKVMLEGSEYSVYSEEERDVLFMLYQSQLFAGSLEEGITDNEIMKANVSGDWGHSQRSVRRALESLEVAGVIELVSQRPKRHQIVEAEV